MALKVVRESRRAVYGPLKALWELHRRKLAGDWGGFQEKMGLRE